MGLSDYLRLDSRTPRHTMATQKTIPIQPANLRSGNITQGK